MRKLLMSMVLMATASAALALENLNVGGTSRTMIVYAPSGLPKSPALVIACHGANQDAAYLQGMANWESVADTAKFVVVYANGINKMWDISGTSDLNFVKAIIDEMHSRYNVNRNRVYLTGFSMGGMFTYYAASKIADKIAAFAPVSGYLMGGPNATSSRPVPILHTHGTSDDVCVYDNVQQHIDAWVRFNGCNTTPVTIKPYPTNKPSSPASMKRYMGGKNGVEVALLTLANKGHWWSMDNLQAITSEEVWNFCKRYTLGADAPEVTGIVPENESFDLIADRDNRFVVSFSDSIDCSVVKASLTLQNAAAGSATSIALDVATQGFAPVVEFALPATVNVPDGEYRLTVSNAKTKAGGLMESHTFTFIYGVQEVGEVLTVDTIYAPDWYASREDVGEGIPKGWKRINTNSSGETETVNGLAANVSGVRMKYFERGGDFDCGFYLSARDNQRCNLYYGFISGNNMKLKAGNYRVSFNSVYWSEGALSAKATYNFHVLQNISTPLFSASSLTSTGTMKENTAQKIKGSKAYMFDFTVPKDAYYGLTFEMSEGWNSVIVGNLLLTTRPSVVELYKGTFYRTLLHARQILVGFENIAAGKALQDVINQYSDFASTSPSAYTAATEALKKAITTFENDKAVAGVEELELQSNTGANKSATHCYDLMGRRVNGNGSSLRGIRIKGNKKVIF